MDSCGQTLDRAGQPRGSSVKRIVQADDATNSRALKGSGKVNTQVQTEVLNEDPALREIVRRLADAYHPLRIYLFGSKARGDAGRDSDYDSLVVVLDDAPPEQRRSRLAYQMLRGTGTAVDVVVCT